jgi:hypothetical protein
MTMKEFMDKVWTANEIVGAGKVVDRRVCYGSMPDIQFTVERPGGGFDLISAKEMFDLGVDFC